MTGALFAVIAPVFLCAAIGFLWARSGAPFHAETITSVVTNVGTPCLAFATLSGLTVPVDSFLTVFGIAVLALTSFGIGGYFLLKLFRADIPSSLPVLLFPNCGNMGLPLALFAFGEDGLALALGFFAVSAVSQFTFGVWLASGRMSIASLLRTPMIHAVILGVAIAYFGISVPQWLDNAISLLAGMTIPLMLIALGVSLSKLRVSELAPSLALSILRLGGGFLVGLALASAFGLTGVERGVVILQCTMPAAVFNYLFALHYKRDHTLVAGTVFLSTLMSFAILPVLLWFLLE